MASRGFGRLADVPVPRWLRAPLIGGFARLVGARPGEAERPPGQYRSLNAFFVRRLAPGVRRWPPDASVLASPVDGMLTRIGAIEEGRLVQAKGRRYSAAALLASEEAAARFHGGLYATIYLAPRHYHRIHAPLAGRLRAASYVPGGLFPVNAAAVAEIPDLLASNERIVCSFAGDAGRVALVAVGAYNVGRISTAFDPGWGGGEGGWVTNRRPRAARRRDYRPPAPGCTRPGGHGLSPGILRDRAAGARVVRMDPRAGAGEGGPPRGGARPTRPLTWLRRAPA